MSDSEKKPDRVVIIDNVSIPALGAASIGLAAHLAAERHLGVHPALGAPYGGDESFTLKRADGSTEQIDPARVERSEDGKSYLVSADYSDPYSEFVAKVAQDTPPDRLCSDPESPHYRKAVFNRGIEVKFKGVLRKNDVVEYCISEGWARIQLKDRKGNTLWRGRKHVAFKIQGAVKVWYKDQPEPQS